MLLRLARGLPAAWQDFPYELLTHDGRPLRERIIVVREAPFPSDAETALPISRGAVLNLWPREESIQPVADLHPKWPCLEIKPNRKLAERFMASQNLHEYGLLIVVAHGTEGQRDEPFLTDGQGWSLPIGRGLPALVILLACGGEDGNLLDYGRTLLDAGARTVLASRGQLDAQEARDFLHAFLHSWLDEGLSTAEALRQAQAKDATGFGARRLYLFGEAGLRWGPTDDPDYASMADLETRARRELAESTPLIALPALCERLTLLNYQQHGTLDELQPPFEEDEEGPLLARLHLRVDTLSPLTRCWALPILACFAENYDQSLIPDFEQRRSRFEQNLAGQVPAASYHHWSKLYYRKGEYALAARDLAAGLGRIGPDQLARQGIGLLGALLNLLIDQALVEPGRRVELLLDQHLSLRDDKLGRRHRRNLKDRSARLALRAGNPDQAHCLYRRRWRNDPTDDRALVWLLYLTAWHPTEQADEYRDKALAQFNAAELVPELGGNDNRLYRLRALAARAWRHDDAEVAETIAAAISFCAERLLDYPDLDAGPPGFTLACLHLYARRSGSAPDWMKRLPSWSHIATALRDQRYFLELAGFSALLGETDEARRALGPFQARRRLVVEELRGLPKYLELPEWDTILADQEARERDGLLGAAPVTPESLVHRGLLPS